MNTKESLGKIAPLLHITDQPSGLSGPSFWNKLRIKPVSGLLRFINHPDAVLLAQWHTSHGKGWTERRVWIESEDIPELIAILSAHYVEQQKKAALAEEKAS